MATQINPDSLPPWIYAISGSASVVVAQTLLYPIDRIGTKLQVQSKQDAKGLPEDQYYHGSLDAVIKIVKSEGIIGLYAGLPGSIIGGAAQGFAFNYWHSLFRQVYSSKASLPQPPGTPAELSMAYGSSALSMLLTLPLTNVTTRQRAAAKEERKGLIGTANEVIQSNDGIAGLWKGIQASLLLCLNPAITYGAVERLRIMLFQGRSDLKLWESFLLGVLSKAAATLVSHPIIVSKVALVSKPPAARQGKPFSTFGEVLVYIVRNEGFFRLWKGLGPGLSKALLFQGLLMILKENLRIQFGMIYRYLRVRRSAGLLKNIAAHRNAINSTRPIVIK